MNSRILAMHFIMCLSLAIKEGFGQEVVSDYQSEIASLYEIDGTVYTEHFKTRGKKKLLFMNNQALDSTGLTFDGFFIPRNSKMIYGYKESTDRKETIFYKIQHGTLIQEKVLEVKDLY